MKNIIVEAAAAGLILSGQPASTFASVSYSLPTTPASNARPGKTLQEGYQFGKPIETQTCMLSERIDYFESTSPSSSLHSAAYIRPSGDVEQFDVCYDDHHARALRQFYENVEAAAASLVEAEEDLA